MIDFYSDEFDEGSLDRAYTYTDIDTPSHSVNKMTHKVTGKQYFVKFDNSRYAEIDPVTGDFGEWHENSL